MSFSKQFYHELSETILSIPEFQNCYTSLTYGYELPDKLSNKQVKKLVESAAILACSPDDRHRSVAQRIAFGALTNPAIHDSFKAASEIILLRLGNFPALEMSITNEGLEDYFNLLSTTTISAPSLMVEIETRKASNQCKTIDDKNLFLTDFQTVLLNSLNSGKNISISAPTSAGKSFIIKQFVMEKMLQVASFSAVYLVPTRALIAQIQIEFRKTIERMGLGGIDIITSAWDIEKNLEKASSKRIMVLTQERLQNILGNYGSNIAIDLLIVDEAQKIEEGARGIVLEDVIDQVLQSKNNAQIVFITPIAKNPEVFQSIFSSKHIESHQTRLSPVSQNILFADFNGPELILSYYSKELGLRETIESRHLGDEIPKGSLRKAWLATKFISSGPTIIYCDTPKDCQETAALASQLIQSDKDNSIIEDVIRFLSETIHPDYFLIKYLRKGIGYHYGYMPQIVKTCVESLFEKKLLDIVCCTSTLMEGVNFPAKNIILHNPKTGKEPMNDIDFLNIAGRGGRLKKDFFGNVYCIDIDEWEGGYRPDIEQKDHFIKSSMDEVVENNKEEIIRHLKKLLKSKPKADVEAAITRFIIKGVQNANEEFIEGMIRRGTKISQAELDKITKLVHDITREIVIPEDVLLTNKSIDPRLQNRLYVALSSKQKLPQLYSVNNNEFYNSLKEILEETYEAFNKKNKTKEIPKVTMNCNLWIKEKTLKEMISDRLNYKRKFGALSSQEINDVIDRTIRMIEKKVRYELSQDVGCYIGIYSHIAEKRNIEVNDMVKNIGYYLELGAYRPTTLTLINNGIPRSLAITLSKRLPQDVTDFDTLKRLIDRQIEQIKIEIPPFLIDEYLTFKTTQLKLNDN